MAGTYREVAHRAFAREFNDAIETFRESDDEFAPRYALLPTGTRMNRAFIAGTLTATEDVGTDAEYWRGRVAEPSGTFFVYAGDYQPEAMGALQAIQVPARVAIVGKPRTYDTDDGATNVAVRPEHIVAIEEPTYVRWVAETARRTLDRIAAFERGEAEDVLRAREAYGDDITPYRDAVIAALEGLEAEEDLATPS